jgi:hypothetical protein
MEDLAAVSTHREQSRPSLVEPTSSVFSVRSSMAKMTKVPVKSSLAENPPRRALDNRTDGALFKQFQQQQVGRLQHIFPSMAS